MAKTVSMAPDWHEKTIKKPLLTERQMWFVVGKGLLRTIFGQEMGAQHGKSTVDGTRLA